MSADNPPEAPGAPTAASISLAGAARALLATVCWSSSALLIDRLTAGYHLTALQISMWRILLVLPLLAIFIAFYRLAAFRIDPRDVLWYCAAGAGITLSNVTWAMSVEMNQPAAAAALGFSAPAFIALGDRLLFKTRIQGVAIAMIALNLVGCGLAAGIRGPEQLLHAPAGLLVGLINGLSFMYYTLLSRSMPRRQVRDPLTTLLSIFVVGEIGMLLWGVPVEGFRLFHLDLDSGGWLLLLSVAVGPTLLAYAFFNSSLRLLPATIASLITTLEPPIVAISAFLLLGRTINGLQWIGIVLIVSAVLVMQLRAAGFIAEGTRGRGYSPPDA